MRRAQPILRALLAVAIVATFTALPTRWAEACTCFAAAHEVQIAHADVAFIGRAIGRRAPADDERARFPLEATVIWTFEVEAARKGVVASRVEVVGEMPTGGNCATDGFALHAPIGVIAGRARDGTLYLRSCEGSIGAAALRTLDLAAPPFGTGSIALLVAPADDGSGVALAALDRLGHPLGYAMGTPATHISVCPGSRRVVGLRYPIDAQASYTVWDLPSLEVVETEPITMRVGEDVQCLDETGARAAFASADTHAWIVVRDGPGAWRKTDEILQVHQAVVLPAAGVVVLLREEQGRWGRILTVYDLATLEPVVDRVLDPAEEIDGIVVNPSATEMAWLARRVPDGPRRIAFVDARGVETSAAPVDGIGEGLWLSLTWADDRSLVYPSSLDRGRVTLRRVGRDGTEMPSVTVGSSATHIVVGHEAVWTLGRAITRQGFDEPATATFWHLDPEHVVVVPDEVQVDPVVRTRPDPFAFEPGRIDPILPPLEPPPPDRPVAAIVALASIAVAVLAMALVRRGGVREEPASDGTEIETAAGAERRRRSQFRVVG